MCMRVVERYAVCKCVYFTHGVDQCGAYGRRGHMVQDRVVLVGHTCPAHSNMGFASRSGSYSSQHSSRSSCSGSSSSSSRNSGSRPEVGFPYSSGDARIFRR